MDVLSVDSFASMGRRHASLDEIPHNMGLIGGYPGLTASTDFLCEDQSSRGTSKLSRLSMPKKEKEQHRLL